MFACTDAKQPKANKKATAKAQSAPYELLVVVNKDWLSSDAGQSLVQLVERPIEGLPQAEPNFRVTYINPHAFSSTFRTYANIMMVEISRQHKGVGVSYDTDVYVRPQTIVRVVAPDNASFERYVSLHGEEILEKFNENEFRRECAFLAKRHSGVVARQAGKQFGVDFYAPSDIDEIKVGKNFFWASAGKQEFRLNVCLYTLPFQPMTLERMVDVRDSVMQVNIPGGKEGQWMETDRRTVSESVVPVNKGRISVWTMRGLWDMKNAAMGGPFVCYAYVDSVRDRLLVAEGFVFAPDEKKRPLIRGLEAALQSLRFRNTE